MLEPLASSCLNISPSRAMGTLFVLNSIILEPPQSGSVYSFGLQQASPGNWPPNSNLANLVIN